MNVPKLLLVLEGVSARETTATPGAPSAAPGASSPAGVRHATGHARSRSVEPSHALRGEGGARFEIGVMLAHATRQNAIDVPGLSP